MSAAETEDESGGSLADLVPSLFAALGVPGFDDRLGIGTLSGLCVVLVDGLGWHALLRHADAAPFLAGAAAAPSSGPLATGFPATTAASLASLATGRQSGEHGLVGYTLAVPGFNRAMNVLAWELYGIGDRVDLIERFPPERFQLARTLFERAGDAGRSIVVAGPAEFATSALTRAVLRGGRYEGAGTLGELVLVAETALRDGVPVYGYHPALDSIGHTSGVGSAEWLAQLSLVDSALGAIAGRLPGGAALVVTGDHGMVNLEPGGKLDLADEPELAAGVRLLAGEARARHVHAVPGAEADVLAMWRGVVGERMTVVSRDEAIEAGWFGPRVADAVRPRIGDVVAAADAPIGIFQRAVDPLQAMLTGHHGSRTPEEATVPLLVVRT